MRKISIVLAIVFLASAYSDLAAAKPRIEGKTVTYSADGVVMKGYLAYDRNITGKRPGVLVVHEWWGLNDYARKRARMLAAMGYTAMAVDMYGGGKQALHPDDAGQFSSELMKNFDTAKARFTAALDFLKKQKTVDPERIAAIGYCFGGGIVLNMARQGVDLKGVASFHGSLAAVTPAQPGMIKARILVLHGADDKFTTPEQVEAFKQEMKNAGCRLSVHLLPRRDAQLHQPRRRPIREEIQAPSGLQCPSRQGVVGGTDEVSRNDLQKIAANTFRRLVRRGCRRWLGIPFFLPMPSSKIARGARGSWPAR